MCLYRKYIVENGGDAESHGDFCCWQLMYRSVKLKGTSVNEEKKKKGFLVGVCRRKTEKGKCLMSLRVGCFFVCLFLSPQIIKPEGRVLYGRRQNSRYTESFVDDREHASK